MVGWQRRKSSITLCGWTPIVEDRRSTDIQRTDHADVHAERETEPCHAEKGVVFGYAQNFDHVELTDDREVAMSVDHAFRQTGGSRGVETETIILGFENRIEMRRSVVCQIGQPFFSSAEHGQHYLRLWGARCEGSIEGFGDSASRTVRNILNVG